MESKRFDAWTRDLIGRRAALTLVFGGAAAVLGLTSTAQAKRKHKKKRCRKSERTCTKDKQCCGKLDCEIGVCCVPERAFTNCAHMCLCPGNEEFCCAFEPVPPSELCKDPEFAQEFCCPSAMVCGDRCCNPDEERCIDGACECILPDQNDCTSGGAGFSRVRRVR